MTMARLRWYALTTMGGLLLAYQVLIDAMSGDLLSFPGNMWTLGIIPLYAVGAWLAWRQPTHPQAVRLLVAGTAATVSGAFGSLMGSQPQLFNSPWFPVLSMLSDEAVAVSTLALALLIGSYPDGIVERSWQRLTLRCSWVVLLGPPLALLASPVLVPSYVTEAVFPNPYAVGWLAWLAEPAVWLAFNSDLVIFVGLLVLCARFVAADSAGRARMRFLFVVVVVGIPLYTAARLAIALGAPEDLAVVVTLVTVGWLGILLPAAIIYGILRHRLFDLDLVVRKSVAYGAALLLIAAAYAVIAAAPGMMLGNRVPVTLAVTVTVTIAAALAFQPVRRRLESAVSRRLFGDRVRQYQLLKNLGTTMEQTAELDELLPRLAHALRDGIGASWVQVRLRDADGSWLDEPVGVAGELPGSRKVVFDRLRPHLRALPVSTWPVPASWSGELILAPGRAAMPPMILSSWPRWPRRPRQQSPTFGSRLSSRRDSNSCPPLASASLRRRKRSVVASSATCMMVSSRRSWRSSRDSGSPATGSAATSSPPTSWPICKIKPVRCFGTSENSPTASTRLSSAITDSSQP